MSDLIPSINWTDYVKVVQAGRLKELKSCEVLFNGEYMFNAIIFCGDSYTDANARMKSEYLAVATNPVGHRKDPQELLEEIRCQSTNSSVKPVVASRRRGNMKRAKRLDAQSVGVR